MADNTVFKTCPGCFFCWQSRDEFLQDSTLELNGYKADFKELEYGLFFFTHKKGGCFSTMALEVNDFLDLSTGTRSQNKKALSTECPRYCMDKKQLNRCEVVCECAFAREIMQIVRERQQS